MSSSERYQTPGGFFPCQLNYTSIQHLSSKSVKMQQNLTVAFLLTLLLATPQYLGQGTYDFLCQNETQIQGKPKV